jgi:AAA domain
MSSAVSPLVVSATVTHEEDTSAGRGRSRASNSNSNTSSNTNSNNGRGRGGRREGRGDGGRGEGRGRRNGTTTTTTTTTTTNHSARRGGSAGGRGGGGGGARRNDGEHDDENATKDTTSSTETALVTNGRWSTVDSTTTSTSTNNDVTLTTSSSQNDSNVPQSHRGPSGSVPGAGAGAGRNGGRTSSRNRNAPNAQQHSKERQPRSNNTNTSNSHSNSHHRTNENSAITNASSPRTEDAETMTNNTLQTPPRNNQDVNRLSRTSEGGGTGSSGRTSRNSNRNSSHRGRGGGGRGTGEGGVDGNGAGRHQSGSTRNQRQAKNTPSSRNQSSRNNTNNDSTEESVPLSMSEQQLSSAVATLLSTASSETTTLPATSRLLMSDTPNQNVNNAATTMAHSSNVLSASMVHNVLSVNTDITSSTLTSIGPLSPPPSSTVLPVVLVQQSQPHHLNLPTPSEFTSLLNVTANNNNNHTNTNRHLPAHAKRTNGPMILSRQTVQNLTAAAAASDAHSNNGNSSTALATSSTTGTLPIMQPTNSSSSTVPSSQPQQSLEEYESHTQHLSELLAEAALFEDDGDDNEKESTTITLESGVPLPLFASTMVSSSSSSMMPFTATADHYSTPSDTIESNSNLPISSHDSVVATNRNVTKSPAPPRASKPKESRRKKPPKRDVVPVMVDPEMMEPMMETTRATMITPEIPIVTPTTTTEALRALPAQEVSITSTTQVKIVRRESSVSLNNDDMSAAPSFKAGATANQKKVKSSSKNQGGIGKKGMTDEGKARSAARRFNNEVRICVENSDPAGVYDLLHDRHNHKFALDAIVLETVMKAYVMAAMFDEALYCLRNCAVPATLSTIQTERILACMPQNLRSSNAYTAADMINQLCVNTIFDTATARTYFLRIVRGIALEFLEEATSARDRICSAPCERLVRAGTCVVDARLERGKKVSELIVLPGDQLGVWQPDANENRGIQVGDAVSILPYAGPYPMSAESLDRNMIEATITNTNPMVLRLQDKANAKIHNMLTENIEGNVFRIDKLANRMGFNRQLSAAVAIASPLGDMTSPDFVRDVRRPCPEIIQAVTAMNENFEQFMSDAVRPAVATSSSSSTTKMKSTTITSSTAALCATAVAWNANDEVQGMDQDSIRTTSRLALEKYGALEGLNESQQLAVECATTNRLTLVQGPPGTGKTRIAICILEHWGRLAIAAAERGEDPAPILATSDSNIAVDNLVEGCAAVGLRVVRLGRPEAIRPELYRFCIDRPPSSYDANRSSGHNQGGGTSGASAYKERTKQLKSAQIICCTCIGSGGDILDMLGPFERVLVDEATQATEPAVLVPLMRGCRQLVLVGDHCQLPPTVLSTRAEEEGHGVPLFSRMVACGVPPHMLDTQYRMHPGIAMFPSDLFYGGLLKNGVSAPERRPLPGFPWPREEFPVAFIPVKGIEMDDGVSKYNEEEANHACRAVELLLAGGQCSVSDIAVVTPYAAQARLIRRMTRRMTGNAGPPYIEVSSVDGFQGREKEAVVFSAVRSNDYGAIGFTSDWRRINVSFTRARRALVVIGNEHTLRRGDPETWMPWLAWADAHGVNVDKPGIARGRYDPEQLRRVRGGTTAAEMLKDVLARQQAQLKQAEHQQERAVKNSAGHIVGGADVDDGVPTTPTITLEEDLARLQNTDGNWDDSDDDDDNNKKVLAHSGSRITLASGASSNDIRSGDDSNGPVDVWDL